MTIIFCQFRMNNGVWTWRWENDVKIVNYTISVDESHLTIFFLCFSRLLRDFYNIFEEQNET